MSRPPGVADVELGLGLLDHDLLDDVALVIDLLAIDALWRTVELRIAKRRVAPE